MGTTCTHLGAGWSHGGAAGGRGGCHISARALAASGAAAAVDGRVAAGGHVANGLSGGGGCTCKGEKLFSQGRRHLSTGCGSC